MTDNYRQTPFATPEKKKLAGLYCDVYPVTKNIDAEALYNSFMLDKEGQNWYYLVYGPFATFAEFNQWLTNTCFGDDPLFYYVCHKGSLHPVGIFSFLNIETHYGSIEIAHVHFSPKLQQTRAATEAFYLLLQYAFAELGYRRVEWKCDNANQRSKQCALRLGFSYEGLFRQHRFYKGRNRDTAWFSIIDKEWPSLKNKYQLWLSENNFDTSGKQIKKLIECE